MRPPRIGGTQAKVLAHLHDGGALAVREITPELTRDQVKAAMRRARQRGLVRRAPEGRWVITQLGERSLFFAAKR